MVVKNLPAGAGNTGSVPELGNPLEKDMTTHSSILAWQPHGLYSGLPFPSLRDLPIPGIEPRSPDLHVDSLSAEPPGKPKNTGVCSHSLLQETFPTQESNWGLLHCRQILYQLSYQGIPGKVWGNCNSVIITEYWTCFLGVNFLCIPS